MSLNRTLSVQSPSPGPQAKRPGGLHTWELPVTDRTGVWLSPVAAGFSGPAWQTLGLVGPAPSIYDLQGSLFCLSVPPSPSGLRSVFSRLPWVIIKRLPLGPLLEGLGWKFLWQGNFSTKLCACSLLTSFPPPNILPSLSHPRPISVGNSPPALLRILQPQTQVRSGTEELGQGMGGGLSVRNPSYLQYPSARPLHLSLRVSCGRWWPRRGLPVKRDPHRPASSKLGCQRRQTDTVGDQRPASQAPQEMKLLCATMRETLSELCA